ncbi:unnamed protein product [Bursaphelenchus xylophilus]|uniref:(pine wood nematode) hypothetical protein n=1 Tax=Bursaphelenchus xylophilus TaxID=6326 RepID=A0A1I7S2G5_BURXY|nr:unnamed protein product [Bursaphelenchus xylophilus]CAG9114571.1 unnamed protein product [Bursaphelenchus xylophilus]
MCVLPPPHASATAAKKREGEKESDRCVESRVAAGARRAFQSAVFATRQDTVATEEQGRIFRVGTQTACFSANFSGSRVFSLRLHNTSSRTRRASCGRTSTLHRGDMSAGKVYVGGLPEDATNEELEDAFHKYGRIRKIWVARRPPGFAFVEFDDPRDAEDAVRALDGARLCGVRARVELSNGRSRGGGGGGGGGRGGFRDDRRDRRDRYRSRSPRGRDERRRSPRRDRSPRRSESPRRSRTRSKSPEEKRRSPSKSRSRSRSRS